MISKILLLPLLIPSTVVGGYYLTKHFDDLKIFDEKSSFLIVKAQNPKTQIYASIAKSSDKIYENGQKKYRCVINNKPKDITYDNSCEIYKFSTTNGSSVPQIIDISKISQTNLTQPNSIQLSDIKEDNFYLLKIDPYKFKNIDNFTEIQLVNLQEFPNQKEFANLRVEAILNGGGKTSPLQGSTTIPLSFSDKFKSNLLLVKLTTEVSSFTWNNSLKCKVGATIKSCNAWKITTQPNNNAGFNTLQINTLNLSDGSTNSLAKDNYYILDIDSRQEEFDVKTSSSQTIQFSNHTQTPSPQNTFTVVSGLFGTIKPTPNNTSTATLTSSDQLVFVSKDSTITI